MPRVGMKRQHSSTATPRPECSASSVPPHQRTTMELRPASRSSGPSTRPWRLQMSPTMSSTTQNLLINGLHLLHAHLHLRLPSSGTSRHLNLARTAFQPVLAHVPNAAPIDLRQSSTCPRRHQGAAPAVAARPTTAATAGTFPLSLFLTPHLLQ